MVMSQRDWDNCIAQWEESYSVNPDKFQHQCMQQPVSEESKFYSVIRKGRKTSKAQFYFTDDGINGDFGFWVPHSAIISESVSQSDDYVEIAGWCKITVIPFN